MVAMANQGVGRVVEVNLPLETLKIDFERMSGVTVGFRAAAKMLTPLPPGHLLRRKLEDPEGLAKLRPAFVPTGSVTAGNASPYSDGAAAVLLMSASKAKELGIAPLARFVSFAVGGVDPDIMGVGPIKAVPKALTRAGLTLKDLKLIEFNEAFAAQALAVIKELDMPTDIINVNGGAIALGHPLGATGAKLTTQLVHELRRRGGGYGMVTMCIGGGMGAAGIFEVYA